MSGIKVKDIVQKNDRILNITWTDGRSDSFDVVELRRKCPCAMCIDEWTGEKRLKPEDVADTVRPMKVDSVGSYAINIKFNDGHGSGFYTFNHLRKLAVN
jgi:DUF971 family protein